MELYLALHCHHQNDSCIQMGSADSHSNVSLILRGKVTRQCPQTITFEKKKGEPKWDRTEVFLLTSLSNALPLSQTGSHLYWAIQAGLLTPLTFARHRLSPLAAFTSGSYFLHEGGDSEFANFTLPTFKAFGGGGGGGRSHNVSGNKQ